MAQKDSFLFPIEMFFNKLLTNITDSNIIK